MKSGIKILRLNILLLFLLLVLHFRSIAQPPTITLHDVVNDAAFGIAQLKWETSNPGLAGHYFIYRQVLPSGSFVQIAQISNTRASLLNEYNDTISSPYCTPTNFSYQIRFVADVNILDNAMSDIKNAPVPLSDINSPVEVTNLNVSISSIGFPVLTWTPVSGDAIKSYEINRFIDSWAFYSNASPNSSLYEDRQAPNICEKSYRYIIVVVDMCNNRSAPDYEKMFVKTLKLDLKQPNACDRVAKLSWNSHEIMPGGLGGYKIYRSDEGNSPVEIDPVLPKDTTYDDSISFVTGHTYTYSVKAYSADGRYTSSSCQATWKSNLGLSPEVYITQASVEANSFVRVSYHIIPSSVVIKLILERSDNGTTNFQPVDSLVAALGSFVPDDHFIDDTTARVQTQSYYYRLVAYDDCNKTKSYNIARSILLQGFTDQKTNTLNWNSYETWNQGVERYTIYRILDEDPSTIEMLGTTDPTRVSYVDLLSGVDPAKAVCYWVVANEISTTAISQSNTFCIPKDPILFMPNAFYPDGINHLLRPVPKPAFVDVQSFKMTIFNRWGQQLFETTDITTGWDGVINGQNAPAGLYTYLLKYNSIEGKEYTKRGTAALVR